MNKRTLVVSLSLALSPALAGKAAAQEVEVHRSGSAAVTAGARVGLVAPQPFSDLGSFALFGVEGGYIIPALERRIQVGGAFYYTRPPASGGGTDDRLAGGTYEWDLKQQMFIVEVSGSFRFLPPGGTITPFGRLGARVYGLRTSLDGESGTDADFGKHREGSTELGMVVGGGVDWVLGPGALVGQLDVGFSDLDEQLTGNTNTGALELSVGYRFFF